MTLKPILIAIAADGPGAGKDTLYNYLKTKKEFSHLENKKLAFYLKNLCAGIVGESYEDFEYRKEELIKNSVYTRRQFLIKQAALLRSVNQDIFINKLMDDFKTFKVQDGDTEEYRFPDWCVTDLRYKNEYLRLKKEGFKIIKIKNDSKRSDEPSESEITDDMADLLLYNNFSLEYFYNHIDEHLFKLYSK